MSNFVELQFNKNVLKGGTVAAAPRDPRSFNTPAAINPYFLHTHKHSHANGEEHHEHHLYK